MCGRFMLDSDIEELLRQYRVVNREVADYNKATIYPSENVPIVMDDKGRTLKSATWGFPLSGKGKLVINARSESLAHKHMFKNSFNNARCIIPANLFYEWKDEGDKKKVKHEIYLKEKNIISLGGLFKVIPDDKGNKVLSFVIVTTESNSHMKDIHSRMPLIINNDALDYWLDKKTSENIIEEIYKVNAMHELSIDRINVEEPFEQMRLF
ncbi:SOS response-associated peptidase [Tissierella sp.]|uniref:SOS response-associated peptidase n=1 Tax=Tissierella sp. TaxID=41274 RepID=UPI0028609415|nr:SOS response-associated peptidase [Tissierella sp.]MDR7857427.1 SOS response-associated peptidase [Tissierella sp.]